MNIFILSGGTSAAWYISNEIKRFFKDNIYLIIGDINPKEYVPSSVLCDRFIRTPYINEAKYYETMLKILKNEQVDVIIPIIDDDLFLFSSDNPDLIKMGVKSSAPSIEVIEKIANKKNMFYFLQKLNIKTPNICELITEINPEKNYFVKPYKGHGSLGTSIMKGIDIVREVDFDTYIVQEMCDTDTGEISADVFSSEGIFKIFLRKRIAVKEGVCVKMVPYLEKDGDRIIHSLRLINDTVKLPLASCVQFMKDSNGEWNLIDFNLRLGAGSALADAAGFHIARGLITGLLNEEIDENWFEVDLSIKAVLRTFQEIPIR